MILRRPIGRLSAESDEHLMMLVAEGHERAYEVLVQRYRPELLRYCSRMGLVDQPADDVLQHALLQAWLALQGETEVRELRPWLYRVVHNAAINAMRRQARDERSPVDGDLVCDEMVEPDLGRGMAVRAALSEVAALPEMQREAILLSAVEGRSHDEVASALGVSSGAVRGLLYRARATLRSAAAAVLPAPLIGWAHGWLARASSAVERLPGMGDGPAVLFKGAAVAATAALVAGAAVTPLHGHLPHRSTPRAVASSHRRSRAAIPLPASALPAADAHAGARLIAAKPVVKTAGPRGTAVLLHLQGAPRSGKLGPHTRTAPPAGRVSAPPSGGAVTVVSGPTASSSIPSQSAQVASVLSPSGGGGSTSGETPKGTSGSGSKGQDSSGTDGSSGSEDSHTEGAGGGGDSSEGHGSDHPEGSEESSVQQEPSEVTGEGKRDN